MFDYNGETIFIDPISKNSVDIYASYWKKHGIRKTPFSDEIINDADNNNQAKAAQQPQAIPSQQSDARLRTYRLAVAVTGEYTALFGGTVAQGLAAVVTSINRVNQVYETDVGVTFVLVANNDLIIYTNASTDPYANSSNDLNANTGN